MGLPEHWLNLSGPQFEDYLETNPVNWRSGFVVFTWVDGRECPGLSLYRFSFDKIEFSAARSLTWSKE